MESNKKEIGKRIAELRKEKGITQAQLADDLGVLRQTVVQWENGDRDLKTDYTVKLANYFDKTCDYIIRGVDAEYIDINKNLGLSNNAIDVLRKLNKSTLNNDKLIDIINRLIEEEVPAPYFGDVLTNKIDKEDYSKKRDDHYKKNYATVLSSLRNYYAAISDPKGEEKIIIDNDFKITPIKKNTESLFSRADHPDVPIDLESFGKAYSSYVEHFKEFLMEEREKKLISEGKSVCKLKDLYGNTLLLEVQDKIKKLMEKIIKENNTKNGALN